MPRADVPRVSWRAAACATRRLALAAAVALAGAAALAADAPPATADPDLEKRVMRLSAELRCLVCQNQTIGDSNADLAVDLRNQVREMLQRGQSEAEVISYMTARYGDFILYKPPLKSTTALLWFGPGLMLVGGGVALLMVLRRRSRLSADQFEPDADADAELQPQPNRKADEPQR